MAGNFEIVDRSYGKSSVKMLHVKKGNPLHEIREFEVNTKLRLKGDKDYIYGDNEEIVATDTQKNTVYLLAKKHGVRTPEEFGMLLCKHFLGLYPQVVGVEVQVEVYPWERYSKNNKMHNHAFVFTPQALRTAYVKQDRNGLPRVKAALSNFRVLKTTQSSFENFVRDDYTTLPYVDDRIFSTIVEANWEYSTGYGVDFDKCWNTVKDAIMEKFAGPADIGMPSPSVQNTLYLAEKMVLEKEKQICSIEMIMPNKHYFNVDFSKFPKELSKGAHNEEVLQPVDKPSGLIQARISRKDIVSKL